ncbi:Tol-Pal system beta propeller repeat protein TolB [Candidatus Magnetomonas plexicatena]|uniref:Tol-Pal system beta propeller repeat protein TolB n=1 Tax=Candidatus Magnetomonas plexicatena TaxID=2552947 RepID=UPI001C76411D|nr:Tol-Pal system beta propeller repeat protein TolB [Nitrospirales bacterium LBB_01]
MTTRKMFMEGFFLTVLVLIFYASADARLYVDITSPGMRKLPIAVQDFPGLLEGKEVSDTVESDLGFTGVFAMLDKSRQVEGPGSPFSPNNWRPLGVDAVVKGTLEMNPNGEMSATVTVYDVTEANTMMKKQYVTRKDLIRPLAHRIADDIYEAITGQKGIFSSKIAFAGQTGEGRSIFLMDYDGERMKKIVSRGSITMKPHWAPDGKKLAYSSLRNGKWGIFMLDFDSATESSFFSSPGTNLAGDFTPDGKYLLLSSSSKGSPDIYMLHITTKVLSRITYSDGIEVSPSPSPDGSRIVFVSDKSTTPQIYTMLLDGTDVRRISYEGNYSTSPEWSPAGDKIVFASIRGGQFQIFTVNPDGGALTQLTHEGTNDEPSFSPDGRYITFTSTRDGAKGVYIMNADGQQQRRITPRNIRAFGPSWSH